MDVPPSYCEATNQHASLGGSLTFKDFIPEVVEEGFFSSKHESFGVLVEKANAWLRVNRRYEVKTCESVEFKSRSDISSVEKMTYMEYGKSSTYYMRGLRLWLVVRNELEQRPPQRIGYYNLVPNIVDEPLLFGSNEYERLDQVLDRFNQSISTSIPGRIISIESQEMKLSKKFNPDCSQWTEHGDYATQFLFVIRIFYEYGTPAGDKIGIADFVPQKITEGALFSHPEYEPFSNVINMASEWCTTRRYIRYCNAQSLELKMKNGYEIDTHRMSYTEHGESTTFYVRILRVTYVKLFKTTLPPPLHLTCKTIVPYQVVAGVFSEEYESLTEVKERLTRWVQLTGARVLSVETAAMRLRTGGERKHGIETSFTYNHANINEVWIYVFRLYLDGYYAEPPAHLMPEPPTPVAEDCCVII